VFADTITIGGGYSGAVQILMDVSGAFRMNIPYGSYGSAAGGTTTSPMVSAHLVMWDDDSRVPEADAGVFVQQYTSQFLIYVDHQFTAGDGFLTTNADPSGTFADPADVRLVLSTTFMVTPSTPTFSFQATLATATGISALALLPGDTRVSEVDFGNSARLSLILPAGVPWTSESGLFLQSVPEPCAGALLAAGMLCLSAFGERWSSRGALRTRASRPCWVDAGASRAPRRSVSARAGSAAPRA
jgi:hypothetical protein